MKQNTKNYDKLSNNAKYHHQNPVVRNQANARERFRTHSVNSAFISLRELIPTEPKTRKLSKIETLRLAKSYIEHLAAMLVTGRTYQPCAHEHSTQSDSIQSLRSRTICTFCLASKSQS